MWRVWEESGLFTKILMLDIKILLSFVWQTLSYQVDNLMQEAENTLWLNVYVYPNMFPATITFMIVWRYDTPTHCVWPSLASQVIPEGKDTPPAQDNRA